MFALQSQGALFPGSNCCPFPLQVLLSQVHRLRALDLLGRFLDLGPWAVSLVCLCCILSCKSQLDSQYR